MVWTRSEITGGCFHMDELARRLRRRLTVIAALGLVVTLATNGLRGDPFLIAAAGKGCSADFPKFCSQQNDRPGDLSPPILGKPVAGVPEEPWKFQGQQRCQRRGHRRRRHHQVSAWSAASAAKGWLIVISWREQAPAWAGDKSQSGALVGSDDCSQICHCCRPEGSIQL
jgi:hypothetical protein